MVLLCYNGFHRPFLVAAAHRRRGVRLETFSSYEDSALCLFQRLGKARMDRTVDNSAPYNGLYRRLALGEGFRNCGIFFSCLHARSKRLWRRSNSIQTSSRSSLSAFPSDCINIAYQLRLFGYIHQITTSENSVDGVKTRSITLTRHAPP